MKPTPKINHYHHCHQAEAKEIKLKEEFLDNNKESAKTSQWQQKLVNHFLFLLAFGHGLCQSPPSLGDDHEHHHRCLRRIRTYVNHC